MKHPALSRALAVVLLILCVVSCLAGLGGLNKARSDYEDSQRQLKKLGEDLEEYQKLLAENEGQENYEQQLGNLDSLREKHEELSAEHHTELATYSATKGGIQTGVEALDEADAAMARARAEFEAKKQEFEAQQAAFMKQYNDFQQGLAALQALKEQEAQLKTLVEEVDAAALESQKQELEAKALALGQEEAELAAREDATEQEWEELNQRKDALLQEQTVFAQKYEGYQQALSGLAALQEQIVPLQMMVDAVDPNALEMGKKGFEEGALALAEGEKQLGEAEYALYHNRALIWYELGQLEEQAQEMAETRDSLLQEMDEISQKQQQSEEQKLREKRLRSLKLGFAEAESVKAALERGEDLVPAVEAYIQSLRLQSQKENQYRILACAWMMAALPVGILCFLLCFELIKKPRRARWAAAMCLLCAVLSLGALWYVGRGLSYAALGLGLFALLQILVSAPLKKKKT